MRNFKLSKKSYLVAFAFVMVLNICLAVFLIKNILAQTVNGELKNQTPIIAEVVKQEDSPILITINNVDNSAESYQLVNFSVQNISSKKIKGYVLVLGKKTSSGKAIISYFQSFVPGQVIQESVSEERVNIKSDEKIFFSIDYVQFEGGSSWGNDSQEQSENILGYSEGEQSAINQVRELFNNSNQRLVTELLERPINAVNPSAIITKKSEKWQKGFNTGYRSLIYRLQVVYEKQGIGATKLKLEEIEKSLKVEEKQ